MSKIVKVKQTCPACPVIYECVTDDDKILFMRYRGGLATVREFDSQDQFDNEFGYGRKIFVQSHGHPLDGYMTFSEFVELAGLEVAEDAEIDLYEDDLFDLDDSSGLW